MTAGEAIQEARDVARDGHSYEFMRKMREVVPLLLDVAEAADEVAHLNDDIDVAALYTLRAALAVFTQAMEGTE